MSRRLAAALLLAAAAARADPVADAPLVLLVGDSTLAPQTGYGDALCQRLEPALACLNLGRGGRSTHSYRAEGLWDAVLARLRERAAGGPAHVLIQFGHNDQPGKPGRSTDLATEYPTNLARYVAELRATGAVPVLVTPLTRRQFRHGELHDDLQPWAEAMSRVAREQQVALADLHALSAAAVRELGPARADLLAQAAPGQPRFDHTHLGARGACVFAGLLSRELARVVPALDHPRTPSADCASVPPPQAAVAHRSENGS
jgi:lysophospholipase L1-like esterase